MLPIDADVGDVGLTRTKKLLLPLGVEKNPNIPNFTGLS